MAILINLKSDSILFRMGNGITQKEVALAFDAFASLLMHMQNTASGLDARLRELSQLNANPVVIRLCITDVWDMIDTAHRIFLIYPLLHIEVDEQGQRLILAVKDIRDSFQHFNERLERHFQQQGIGDSVLGDFEWLYRANAEENTSIYIAKAGVTLGGARFDMTNTQSKHVEEQTGPIGVFGVKVHYVKREIISVKGKTYAHPKVMLEIDSIVSEFNRVIAAAEKGYTKIFEEKEAQNPGKKIGQGLPLWVVKLGAKQD